MDASVVCACTLPLQCISLALSADEQLLAICESTAVSVYSLQALVSGSSRDPVATWHLPAGATLKQVRWLHSHLLLYLPDKPPDCCEHSSLPHLSVLVQFAWRPLPQEGTPPEAAVVTSAGGLLHGCLGGVLKDFLATSTAATCCAWSADGSALAHAAEDVVTVQRVAPAAAFSLRVKSQVRVIAFCAACSLCLRCLTSLGKPG